ncbi:Starch-binding associating with outer membrane [Lutibacter agarilyticus]|uniref:Starch-binding associating with outer membrane n=1 Tax=Lutibacter agarilyticus TaxID=1109740 RepID=A0A238YSS9_9FLAO|nr:RagB/SusD family nutrient uptake outer membrane protein [Lutibacter agarilyticus]SNR73724.1 Starch-binding associating with outer membrane [Lutibacter agarilyticus]
MRQIKILILLFVGVSISSCSDFLSPEPLSAITADSYFKNDSEILTGVINMYDGIQGLNSTRSTDNHGIQQEFQVTEMRSDNTRTKSGEGESAQFDAFNVDPTNGIVADYYRSYYNVVYRANIVLNNLGSASDAMKPSFEAEAKFVRAYAYFNLVRLFGDIPLIDKVIDPLEKEIQFTRVNEDLVYDLIVSDLITAVDGLGAGTYGRASKSAAQALLAKVYLTLGEHSLAKQLCLDVMGAGFTLESNFKDIFYNEGNDEVIWAIVYDGDNATDSQNFSAEWLNSVGRTVGLNYVTTEAAAALDLLGGSRTKYSYRLDEIQISQNQVAKYIPNGDANLGIEPTSGDPTLAGNDWIIMRYADVLLMYVEATMGTATETSDASALIAFNKIRARADMPLASSITKQELLDERRAELAFENQRWFDLIRFGAANEVYTKFSADNGYGYSPTDLLLPIPQGEIGLSAGLLTQNPGY